MPDITAIAGKVAGIVSLAAFIPYIVTTLRGKTKPNQATWWIWALVGFMLGASYWAAGAKHTIWVPISYVIGPLIVALLSLKYGVRGWTSLDKICVAIAGISAILWWVSKSPIVALTINLIIDALGAIPTAKKAYQSPEGEDRVAWALFFAGNTANLFAIETWTPRIVIYPLYLFIGCGIITAFVLFRPRSKSAH